jgi:hypothetical protein
MNPFGKSLLAGLVAGMIAALLGYGGAALFVNGDDPENIRASVMLGLTFLAGSVTCGVAAARFRPQKAFSTAVLAALTFEAILLVIARTGLNWRALALAFGVASLFGLIGAFIGLPRTKPS